MKKILKSICFSVLAFLFAIGSLFIPITSNNTKSAHADNTSSLGLVFNSSNVIYSMIGNRRNSDVSYRDGYFSSLLADGDLNNRTEHQWYNWNFRIEYVDNDSYQGVSISPYLRLYAYGAYNDSIGTFPTDTMTSSPPQWVLVGETISLTSMGSYYSDYSIIFTGLNSYAYYSLFASAVIKPTGVNVPSLDMVSIELGNYYDFNIYRDFLDSSYCNKFTNSNIVVYTDTTGFKYFFFIPNLFTYDTLPASYLSYRKYYTSYSESFNNNEFYNQGLNDGYSKGFSEGENQGYREGSSVGYENGYEDGKLEGALTANNYSFFGLISAIIDAPVKVLTSLFNFNFLGVNLWAFFTSILTISLIIFVIRKFMAKG